MFGADLGGRRPGWAGGRFGQYFISFPTRLSVWYPKARDHGASQRGPFAEDPLLRTNKRILP
jgi:hypothetical protein